MNITKNERKIPLAGFFIARAAINITIKRNTKVYAVFIHPVAVSSVLTFNIFMLFINPGKMAIKAKMTNPINTMSHSSFKNNAFNFLVFINIYFEVKYFIKC